MKNRSIQSLVIANYRIIGYSDYKTGCLKCVSKRIQDNLNIQDSIQEIYQVDLNDKNIIEEINKQLQNEIEISEDLFIYDVIHKKFDKISIFNYPQCSCSKELPMDSQKNNSENVYWPDYRLNSFNQIIEMLQPSLKTLIHPVFGVLKNHYKAISDVMPLIALEGQVGKRSFDSYGRQSDFRTSYYTAILEGLERIHGIAPFTSSNCYKSEKELSSNNQEFLSLIQFLNYSSEEMNNPSFNFDIYSETEKINWVKAKHLNTNETYLVPEQMVYFSTELLKKQKRFLYESSNGMAIGSSVEEATLSGLLEVIERDSFLVHWYLKKSPIKLTKLEELNSQKINMMLKYLKDFGYYTHVFDITLDSGIPSIWILLEQMDKSNNQKICFYTAGGSSFNFVTAIETALIEAATSIKVYNHYLKNKYKEQSLSIYIDNFSKVNKLEDHIFLYSSNKMRDELSFAIYTEKIEQSKQRALKYKKKVELDFKGDTQKDILNNVLKKIQKNHPDVFVSRLTSSSLSNIGLECVKVMIPSMQNISFGHQYKNINSRRLHQIAGSNYDINQHNRTPHPFP